MSMLKIERLRYGQPYQTRYATLTLQAIQDAFSHADYDEELNNLNYEIDTPWGQVAPATVKRELFPASYATGFAEWCYRQSVQFRDEVELDPEHELTLSGADDRGWPLRISVVEGNVCDVPGSDLWRR